VGQTHPRSALLPIIGTTLENHPHLGSRSKSVATARRSGYRLAAESTERAAPNPLGPSG